MRYHILCVVLLRGALRRLLFKVLLLPMGALAIDLAYQNWLPGKPQVALRLIRCVLLQRALRPVTASGRTNDPDF
jgi:hypothetical protein